MEGDEPIASACSRFAPGNPLQDEGQQEPHMGGNQTLLGCGRLVNGSYSSYFTSSQSQTVHHTAQSSLDLSCRESLCSF